jgi:hypothetical protein
MHILTVENKIYDLNRTPDTMDDDIRFSILDNSDPKDPDFLFPPLFFLESFTAPAMVLNIGQHQIAMPLDWSIAVGDTYSGCDLEIMPLTSINGREFDAFCYNPLTSFRIEFKPIKITGFYNDVTWYLPKLKTNNLLSIPITTTDNPLCVFFIKEYTKQSETIDLYKLL